MNRSISIGQYIYNRSIPKCSVETAEQSYRHKLRRTERKSKTGEKEQRTDQLSDTESQTLDLMLLKLLSNALQLNL